jgi:hypothetical protein
MPEQDDSTDYTPSFRGHVSGEGQTPDRAPMLSQAAAPIPKTSDLQKPQGCGEQSPTPQGQP